MTTSGGTMFVERERYRLREWEHENLRSGMSDPWQEETGGQTTTSNKPSSLVPCPPLLDITVA